MTVEFGTGCKSCHTAGVNRKGEPCLRCKGMGIEPSRYVPTRRDDPQTSHEAAQSVDLTRGQRIVYDILRQHGPMTDEQLVHIVSFNRGEFRLSDSGARTRRSELARDGYVVDTGKRSKTAANRDSIVWGAARHG